MPALLLWLWLFLLTLLWKDGGLVWHNGALLALDESGQAVCCCSSSGGVAPCCPCTETDVPLTMSFTAATPCGCWTGHELSLETNCENGRLSTLDETTGDPPTPAGCTLFDQLAFNADCAPESAEPWTITIAVTPVGGGASVGVTATNVVVHSCDPIHITGQFVLDLTTDAIWCDGTNTGTATINFEITE